MSASSPTPPSMGPCNTKTASWISIASAANRAGNSPRTIKRWIAAGYLQATRLPTPKGMGPLRVRLGDVESLIASGAVN